MILSPDGKCLVIVLLGHQEKYEVYLCQIEDIQNTSDTRELTSSLSLPWKHQLLNQTGSRDRLEISHVESVQFSEDSKLIALLSQPSGPSTQIFYGWSLNESRGKRQYINKIRIALPVRRITLTQI
jgi:hypothetical protein